jgi:hypothetical protein
MTRSIGGNETPPELVKLKNVHALVGGCEVLTRFTVAMWLKCSMCQMFCR